MGRSFAAGKSASYVSWRRAVSRRAPEARGRPPRFTVSVAGWTTLAFFRADCFAILRSCRASCRSDCTAASKSRSRMSSAISSSNTRGGRKPRCSHRETANEADRGKQVRAAVGRAQRVEMHRIERLCVVIQSPEIGSEYGKLTMSILRTAFVCTLNARALVRSNRFLASTHRHRHTSQCDWPVVRMGQRVELDPHWSALDPPCWKASDPSAKRWKSLGVTDLIRHESPRPNGGDCRGAVGQQYVQQFAWPWRALQCEYFWCRWNETWSYAVQIPEFLHPVGGRPLRAIPLRPIWSGLIFNSLVFTAIGWAATGAVRRLRRRRRARKGPCVACGYPSRTFHACPECGAPPSRNTCAPVFGNRRTS